MRWLCAGSGRPNRALLPSPEKEEERHQLKDIKASGLWM
jgi:hypothetical protein